LGAQAAGHRSADFDKHRAWLMSYLWRRSFTPRRPVLVVHCLRWLEREFKAEPDEVLQRQFPPWRGAIMAEDRTNAPSAEEFKDRLKEMDEQTDSGAGEGEADPVTADSPPQDIKPGDEKRVQT